jgi:hypothetical protein
VAVESVKRNVWHAVAPGRAGGLASHSAVLASPKPQK